MWNLIPECSFYQLADDWPVKVCYFCFFCVLLSSASNGGPIHMARTSGSVHMERSTVGHAPAEHRQQSAFNKSSWYYGHKLTGSIARLTATLSNCLWALKQRNTRKSLVRGTACIPASDTETHRSLCEMYQTILKNGQMNGPTEAWHPSKQWPPTSSNRGQVVITV